MPTAELETIAQQIQRLGLEEKWTLLSILVESLHRDVQPPRRLLCDYYGIAKGRHFQTAREVDTFIEEERASWEE